MTTEEKINYLDRKIDSLRGQELAINDKIVMYLDLRDAFMEILKREKPFKGKEIFTEE